MDKLYNQFMIFYNFLKSRMFDRGRENSFHFLYIEYIDQFRKRTRLSQVLCHQFIL